MYSWKYIEDLKKVYLMSYAEISAEFSKILGNKYTETKIKSLISNDKGNEEINDEINRAFNEIFPGCFRIAAYYPLHDEKIPEEIADFKDYVTYLENRKKYKITLSDWENWAGYTPYSICPNPDLDIFFHDIVLEPEVLETGKMSKLECFQIQMDVCRYEQTILWSNISFIERMYKTINIKMPQMEGSRNSFFTSRSKTRLLPFKTIKSYADYFGITPYPKFYLNPFSNAEKLQIMQKILKDSYKSNEASGSLTVFKIIHEFNLCLQSKIFSKKEDINKEFHLSGNHQSPKRIQETMGYIEGLKFADTSLNNMLWKKFDSDINRNYKVTCKYTIDNDPENFEDEYADLKDSIADSISDEEYSEDETEDLIRDAWSNEHPSEIRREYFFHTKAEAENCYYVTHFANSFPEPWELCKFKAVQEISCKVYERKNNEWTEFTPALLNF